MPSPETAKNTKSVDTLQPAKATTAPVDDVKTVEVESAEIKSTETKPTKIKSVEIKPIVPVPEHIIKSKVTLLETTFNTIYKERMNDVPIINDKIEVSVIGFQYWQNSYLCVVITPWFMNLMLLPGESENWDDKRETTSSKHTFPSGNYQFLVGFEPDIGKYQMCSLFSPMFEFTCNDAAVETAKIVIKELMNIENIEQSDIDSAQLEAIWDGTEEHPDKMAAREEAQEAKAKALAEAPPRIPLKERMQQPVSRRRLLRGAFMLDDEQKTKTATNVGLNETEQKKIKPSADTQAPK